MGQPYETGTTIGDTPTRGRRNAFEHPSPSVTPLYTPCDNFCTISEGGTPLNYKTRDPLDLKQFCAPLCPRHKKCDIAVVVEVL